MHAKTKVQDTDPWTNVGAHTGTSTGTHTHTHTLTEPISRPGKQGMTGVIHGVLGAVLC